MDMPTSYNAVYYVEGDVPLNPLGIRPTVDQNLIWWNDTTPGRGRSFYLEKMAVDDESGTPKLITLITDDHHTITLSYLTCDLYNRHVRERAVGKPEFTSDQALQKYYLETDFDL